MVTVSLSSQHAQVPLPVLDLGKSSEGPVHVCTVSEVGVGPIPGRPTLQERSATPALLHTSEDPTQRALLQCPHAKPYSQVGHVGSSKREFTVPRAVSSPQERHGISQGGRQ